MSLFNFRRPASATAPNATSGAQTESVEVIRRRARHRLIGSAVLVLVGIVGFPLLFDTQPRPIAVDIPIEIPSKTSVKPLTLPAVSADSAPARSAPAATPASPVGTAAGKPPERVAVAASLGEREEIFTDKKAAAPAKPAASAIKTEAKPAPKAEPRVEAKAESKPEVKPEVKPAMKLPPPAAASGSQDDGARAKALLDGKPGAAPAPAPAPVGDTANAVPAASGEARLIVQVGAFADVAKAREARLKLEKAGMKTYTQVAETTGGKRIRVRVGPFATKAEADKAASKIKALDLPAAVLSL